MGVVWGGVCDHINHFCYHIKEIKLLKAWGGAAVMKGPGENTVQVISLSQNIVNTDSGSAG